MQLVFKKGRENLASILRQAGYAFQYESAGQLVFRRVLGSSGYPRFHIYANDTGGQFVVNLHLDQKKDTHGDATRHHGEYEESAALEDEARRVEEIVRRELEQSETAGSQDYQP